MILQIWTIKKELKSTHNAPYFHITHILLSDNLNGYFMLARTNYWILTNCFLSLFSFSLLFSFIFLILFGQRTQRGRCPVELRGNFCPSEGTSEPANERPSGPPRVQPPTPAPGPLQAPALRAHRDPPQAPAPCSRPPVYPLPGPSPLREPLPPTEIPPVL